MKKLLGWLHWLMILLFGLLLYTGVKGGLKLLEARYEGTGSMIPMAADLFLGGILSVGLILIFSYVLAPKGKMAAVVCVALSCIAFNGYFELWKSWKAMTETPLWQAGLLTGLSLITSLATWKEIKNYHIRKNQTE